MRALGAVCAVLALIAVSSASTPSIAYVDGGPRLIAFFLDLLATFRNLIWYFSFPLLVRICISYFHHFHCSAPLLIVDQASTWMGSSGWSLDLSRFT